MFAISLLLLTAMPMAPAQESEAPPSLPAVDSKEVAESHAAYTEWCAAAVERKVIPFYLTYEVAAYISMSEGPDDIFGVEGDLTAEGNLGFRSGEELQHSVWIKMDAREEGSGAFDLDLLMDGKKMSVYVQSDFLPMVENGYRVEVEQDVLETVYQTYLDLGSDFLSALAEEGDAEAESTRLIFDAADGYFAPDFVSFFHPTIYWNTSNPYLICRSFHKKDDLVEAVFTLDTGEDSVLLAMVQMFIAEEMGGEQAEEEVDAIMEMVHSFIERNPVSMSFDAHSGIPLAVDFDWSFRGREYGLEEDYDFQLRANYRATLQTPKDPNLVHFHPQPEAEGFMDATPFVHMFLSELQGLVDSAEAEDDMDF
ncbi:MAG: hypothetical protein ACPG31_00630 [Planctomycetota bacterium]